MAITLEPEGRSSEEGGRRMNLVGDSNPNQINAAELKIQQGTQTLTSFGREKEEVCPSSFFLLPSSFFLR